MANDTQHYAKCWLSSVSFILCVTYKPFMVSFIMMNVIMLSVIMLSVIMLSIIMLSV